MINVPIKRHEKAGSKYVYFARVAQDHVLVMEIDTDYSPECAKPRHKPHWIVFSFL